MRMNLSSQGYTISKWQNNIDLERGIMHAARWNRFNALSTGFPDFVAFRKIEGFDDAYEVVWVEAKMNGKLTAAEKAKLQFMTDRGMMCWIASVNEKEIEYRKFVDYIESGRIHGEEARCYI